METNWSTQISSWFANNYFILQSCVIKNAVIYIYSCTTFPKLLHPLKNSCKDLPCHPVLLGQQPLRPPSSPTEGKQFKYNVRANEAYWAKSLSDTDLRVLRTATSKWRGNFRHAILQFIIVVSFHVLSSLLAKSTTFNGAFIILPGGKFTCRLTKNIREIVITSALICLKCKVIGDYLERVARYTQDSETGLTVRHGGVDDLIYRDVQASSELC